MQHSPVRVLSSRCRPVWILLFLAFAQAGRCDIDPKLLIKLLRNLQYFYSLYVNEGIDALTGPEGEIYSIFDLMDLYNKRSSLLSPQRAKAVELVFYRDMTERDAALAMGLAPGAPVSSYASQGAKLLAAAWDGPAWQGEAVALRAQEHEAPQRDVPPA